MSQIQSSVPTITVNASTYLKSAYEVTRTCDSNGMVEYPAHVLKVNITPLHSKVVDQTQLLLKEGAVFTNLDFQLVLNADPVGLLLTSYTGEGAQQEYQDLQTDENVFTVTIPLNVVHGSQIFTGVVSLTIRFYALDGTLLTGNNVILLARNNKSVNAQILSSTSTFETSSFFQIAVIPSKTLLSTTSNYTSFGYAQIQDLSFFQPSC